MASPRDEFVDHCAELLGSAGPVRVRRMFGGHGLYAGAHFIAIVMGEQLYLKVDESTRARFEHAGCTEFVYEAKGRRVGLNYWTAPAEAMESAAEMRPWAHLALQAASHAKAKSKKRTIAPAKKIAARPPAAKRPAAKPVTAKRARRSPKAAG